MENIRTVLCDLPNSIKGFTVATPDGFFTICLNQNHSHEQNMLTYAHEMKHIKNGDFDRRCSVDLIEIMARKEDV